MKAIILAAGRGTRLKEYTKDISKHMLDISGKPLLEYSLNSLQKNGVEEALIIVGYKKDKIKEKFKDNYKGMKITYLENPDYSATNNMFSLSKAKDYVYEDSLVLEGDLLYEEEALRNIINHPVNVTLIAPVSKSDDEGYVFSDNEGNLLDLTLDASRKAQSNGELVGITKLSIGFLQKLFETAESEYKHGIRNQGYYDMILKISKIIPVKCLLKDVVWIGVNHGEDLENARKQHLKF